MKKKKEGEESEKEEEQFALRNNWNDISREHGSLFRESLQPVQPSFPSLILVTTSPRHLPLFFFIIVIIRGG